MIRFHFFNKNQGPTKIRGQQTIFCGTNLQANESKKLEADMRSYVAEVRENLERIEDQSTT